MNRYLVTWGNSGIGRAVISKILEQDSGNHVVSLDQKLWSREKEEHVHEFVIDLTSCWEIEKFIKSAKENNRSFTHLVNNAGFQESFDILDSTINKWRSLFSLHLDAAFMLCQYVCNDMISRWVKWTITNITSIHDTIIRDIAHYSSSKAALAMFSNELAVEVAKHGIRVNLVAPGAIKTALIEKDLTTSELVEKAAWQKMLCLIQR